MLTCHELSRLPKPPRITSLLFRHQTPGDPTTAHIPFLQDRKVLDPTHPAANLNRRLLPVVRNDKLHVFTAPLGILEHPELPRQPPFDRPIELWKDRVTRTLNDPDFRPPQSIKDIQDMKLLPALLPKFQKPNRMPMSMIIVVAKRVTSKHKHVRLQIIHKLRAALGLIVARGADVKGGKIVIDDEKALQMMDKWVLRGWSYTFIIQSLELYRMPLTELIPSLRNIMSQLYKQGSRFENQWAQDALKDHLNAPSVASSSRRVKDTVNNDVAQPSFRQRQNNAAAVHASTQDHSRTRDTPNLSSTQPWESDFDSHRHRREPPKPPPSKSSPSPILVPGGRLTDIDLDTYTRPASTSASSSAAKSRSQPSTTNNKKGGTRPEVLSDETQTLETLSLLGAKGKKGSWRDMMKEMEEFDEFDEEGQLEKDIDIDNEQPLFKLNIPPPLPEESSTSLTRSQARSPRKAGRWNEFSSSSSSPKAKPNAENTESRINSMLFTNKPIIMKKGNSESGSRSRAGSSVSTTRSGGRAAEAEPGSGRGVGNRDEGGRGTKSKSNSKGDRGGTGQRPSSRWKNTEEEVYFK
ncbi:hypothetical protein D9758_006665 [Tetrapyrgos nigripes]|uniref:Uncharacterized protein n=1 Tax=Tetrapyrgos nigripes TaxID=182062 RepID=A0A8H5LQR1_9AGAR|nr:hypothetical protein D9758_006665 [Tetrapyrgos nigripes]